MATGNGSSKARILILVVVLAAVAAVGWYRYQNGGFGGSSVETDIINGTFSGGTLDAVTAALGVQPVEQPNLDGEKSTAKIYLYTLPDGKRDRQFIRARVSADGKVIYTRYVDSDGKEVVIEQNR